MIKLTHQVCQKWTILEPFALLSLNIQYLIVPTKQMISSLAGSKRCSRGCREQIKLPFLFVFVFQKKKELSLTLLPTRAGLRILGSGAWVAPQKPLDPTCRSA